MSEDIKTTQTAESGAKGKKKGKKWIIPVILAIVLVPVVVAFVILYGRIATVASIEKIDGDFYRMTYNTTLQSKVDTSLRAILCPASSSS